MIKKPVLGLAGVFLAGLTLTGCQNAPQKTYQPPNPGLAGTRTSSNGTPTNNATLTRNGQGTTNAFSNSGAPAGGAGSVNQANGYNSPMGGNGGFNMNPAPSPSTNFGANPTGGGLTRTSGSPTSPGSGPMSSSSANFAPIDQTPVAPAGQAATMGYGRTSPPSAGIPITPPLPPSPGSTTTQYSDPSTFGPGPMGGAGSPALPSPPMPASNAATMPPLR